MHGHAWAHKIADTTPYGALLRHFVVGDLLGTDGTPDVEYLTATAWLATVRPDLKQFAYTHAWRRDDVHPTSLVNTTLNASCETATDLVTARAQGFDTVLTAETLEDALAVGEEAGVPVTLCPTYKRDDVGCADCGLCAKRDRKVTVVFLTHGQQRAKAAAVIARRKEVSA